MCVFFEDQLPPRGQKCLDERKRQDDGEAKYRDFIKDEVSEDTLLFNQDTIDYRLAD